MGLLDSILAANNGQAVTQIARQLGIPEAVAKQAAGALVPALSKGLQRNTSTPGGLDSLLGALGGGGHQKYIDQPETLAKEETISDGNAILGHILGSKDVSRNVAGNAAQKTGIDSDILKKMLPMLGTVAMGALAKQATGGGQLQGLTKGIAGNTTGDPLSMLTGFLDQDDDGDPTDDILNMAKKFF